MYFHQLFASSNIYNIYYNVTYRPFQVNIQWRARDALDPRNPPPWLWYPVAPDRAERTRWSQTGSRPCPAALCVPGRLPSCASTRRNVSYVHCAGIWRICVDKSSIWCTRGQQQQKKNQDKANSNRASRTPERLCPKWGCPCFRKIIQLVLYCKINFDHFGRRYVYNFGARHHEIEV